MKPNFDDWEKFVESSGSIVTEIGKNFTVDGDVILINCGLTHIPGGLVEVTGTLDISLNPIESFKCSLKNVGRLICMGTMPKSLTMNEKIFINGKMIYGKNVDEESKYLVEHVKIQDYEPEDIIEAYKFNDLKNKIPELEGIF